MEPLPGRTLQQALDAAGPLPVRQVTRVGLRLVDVLQATHQAGIVHRDVTPGNVHLCGGGRVVLTDFGIACTIDDASPAAGTFPGTPAYVSPERLDGGDSGPACDLFSLGATLFTAVEGRPPFDRGSLVATLTAVLVDGPAPFLRAGPLRPVIEGLLAKDPGRRLSAGQARAALRAIQREHDTAQVQTSWTYASPPASAPFRGYRRDFQKDGLSSSLRCRGVVDRQDDLHDGTRPGRAVQPDPAAERLDPILEPDQARAVAEIRAATPVVADTHLQERRRRRPPRPRRRRRARAWPRWSAPRRPRSRRRSQPARAAASPPGRPR